MKRAELRLELIKLTHTLGRTSAEAVGRAKELEEFILAEPERGSEAVTESAPTEKRGPGRPRKVGNPNPLS
jgi:hypothetical protein